MTTHKLRSTQRTAANALHDDIEHALIALCTASLDDEGGMPALMAGEFATEFLIELNRLPSTGGMPRD